MVEFRGGAKIHTLGANSSWHQASTFFFFSRPCHVEHHDKNFDKIYGMKKRNTKYV
jgi:hypothetical protein